MERYRNWPAWIALALAGLALLVAFGGRFMPQQRLVIETAQVATAVPEQEYEGHFRQFPPQFEGEFEGRRWVAPGGQPFEQRWNSAEGHGPGGWFNVPFLRPFLFGLGLLRAISTILFFGLMTWLVIRLLRNRNTSGGSSNPTPPTI